jgi:hypothetical protein
MCEKEEQTMDRFGMFDQHFPQHQTNVEGEPQSK